MEKSLIACIPLLILLVYSPYAPAQDLLSYDSVVEDGVGDADGLEGVWHSAISPDGKHIYTAGFDENKVGVFERNATTGDLSFVETKENGVDGVDGLGWAGFILISADGAYVYVASWNDDAIVVFSRAASTGELTFIEVHKDGVNGVSGINVATSIAISPDGLQLYTTGNSSNAVAIFDRDLSTGTLSYQTKIAQSRLSSARSVAISPDGSHVYVAASFYGAITVFDRDSNTGSLTQNEVVEDGQNGVDGIGGVWWIVLSEDGQFLYVAGTKDDSIALFSRDTTTGKLTLIEVHTHDVAGVENLNGVSAVTLNSDERYLLATSSISDALVLFERDTVTGKLTYVESHKNNIFGDINKLNYPSAVTVGPQDTFYVAAAYSNSLSEWTFADTEGSVETPTPGSLANLGASATNLDPINTFNGELFTRKPRDLDLAGPMPLYFQRYYAAYLRRNFVLGDLGSNWRHNFDARIYWSGNTLSYISHDGRVTEFLQDVVTDIWAQTTNTDTPYQLSAIGGQDAQLYDPQLEQILTFDFSSANVVIGKLISIEDAHGNTHTLTYNLDNGQLLTVSDGLGRNLSFTYNDDSIPKISVITDGTRSVSFQYTDSVDSEYLTQVTDARLGVTEYRYEDTSANADHALMTSSSRPLGNSPYSQTFYDTSNQLASGRVATQSDSSSNTYSLDYSGLETTLTDPSGNTLNHSHSATGEFSNREDETGLSFSMGSDSTGRRISLTDRLGDTTTLAYDSSNGNLAEVVNADGTTKRYTYTARSFAGFSLFDITRVVHADDSSETLVYDANGNVTSRTDRAGNISSATYNANGQALTATNEAGGTFVRSYNADATLATLRDAAGNKTNFEYDDLRRLSQQTFADGSISDTTYNDNDQLLTISDENGGVLKLAYDANGNLSTRTDALLNSTRFTYDGNDRLLTIKNPLGAASSRSYNAIGKTATSTDANTNVTTLGYDNLRRLTSITDPSGERWTATYDAEAVLASRTDPLLNTTTFTSDSMGRITSIRSPLGHTTRTSYNATGKTLSFTDALDATTSLTRDSRDLLTGISLPEDIFGATYERNALGLITRVIDPEGNHWDREFDVSGRKVSSTDPLSNRLTMTYDNRHRLANVTFPDELGTQTLAYDPTGNLIGIDYSDGTTFTMSYNDNARMTSANGITQSFDANNRLTESNGIRIVRDAGGRITQMTLAPGKAITYAYDANDRVSQVTDWADGETLFEYDAAGRLTTITRPNGVNASRTYDNDGRLSELTEGSFASISYTRNANGDITGATHNVPLTASASDLLSTSQTIDAASQLNDGSYDAMGRLLSNGANTYAWDLSSRLTRVTTEAGTATATYDMTGKRLSRTFDGVTRDFTWNYALGLTSISIEREGGIDLRYYVHTPGGELLYSVNALSDTRRFYHFGDAGNVLFVTNDVGGIVASYAYTPYGQLIAKTGSLDNPFTWLGQYGVMDDGGNLYYIRDRYYDALSQRFISRDPISSISPLAINPYQYALGNPLTFLDVTGRESQRVKDAKAALKKAQENIETTRGPANALGAKNPAIKEAYLKDYANFATTRGPDGLIRPSNPEHADAYAIINAHILTSFKLRDEAEDALKDIRREESQDPSSLGRFSNLFTKSASPYDITKKAADKANRAAEESAREAVELHLLNALDTANDRLARALEAVKYPGQYEQKQKNLKEAEDDREQAAKALKDAGIIKSVIPELSGIVVN